MRLIAQKTKRRSEQGFMSMALFGFILTTMFAIGALAMDVAHGAMVRAQLQIATEAGALAGAQELAKETLTSTDTTNAQNNAINVTAANKADGTGVSNSAPNTTVNVTVDTTGNPRTVTVTATQSMQTVFSKIFGADQTPISAISKAAATNGIQVLYGGQAKSLAVSIDVIPSHGPQKDNPLSSYTGANAGQPFTLVLNPTNDKNCCWINDWSANASPDLTIGSTQITMNGTKGESVSDIQPGSVLLLPLIQGDDFNGLKTIIGIIGFYVTDVDFPHKVTGTLAEPMVEGIAGSPPVPSTTTSQDNLFLSENNPWKVALLQ